MRYWSLVFFLICSLTGLKVAAQTVSDVKSPNGKLLFSFRLIKGQPVYDISCENRKLIANSSLGLTFKDGDVYGDGLELEKPVYHTREEEYRLVTGKASVIHSTWNELMLPLRETRGAGRRIRIAVRVFNDGIAFRYEFPKQDGWDRFVLTDENSTFNICGDPKIKTLLFDQYHNSHEGLYANFRYRQAKENVLMDLPALLQFKDCFMAITEANLHNYAGMYLTKKGGVLTSSLSPLPGNPTEKVKVVLPHQTPWRVLMIGQHIGDLIASNILTDLNEAPATNDWSWLKPGKTTFHWWNGDVLPEGYQPQEDFKSNQYYIDFAAKNHIEYHSIIGYNKKPWYTTDWPDYNQPGTYADLTQPVATLDMQKICSYARSKGVGIHVWVNWKALYPQLDTAFAVFEKWGIKGMMVDFLDRDDQEMVNIQEEILKKAAAHHLFIQFHGAYKATGMNRTYPNELTREGTYNYEQNKWSKIPVSPEHDLDIVFTRMLGGASDYHLGGFRAVPPSAYSPRFVRPLMVGTRCHMLAMYVVLESYLSMVADYPEAYKDQAGFEFLQEVPATWDETVVPAAEVDNYACVARRKGNDWFIGVINNSHPRKLNIQLGFLKGRNYSATCYMDPEGQDSADPNRLVKTVRQVRRNDTIRIPLSSGGGCVIHLKETR